MEMAHSSQQQRSELLHIMEKFHEQRTPEELLEHYEIEKELANRLRTSERAERKTLYSRVYDEFNQRVPFYRQLSQQSEHEAVDTSPQWRFYSRFLRPETVFLEIGAGTCGNSLVVARHVKKVYALEVSEEVIRDVHGPANFSALLFDGFSIPPLPTKASVAYSDQVLEHIHPDDALEQVKSVYQTLAPGGVYVCITPNGLNGPHDISRFFDVNSTGFHLKEYTNTELSKVLRLAGFARIVAYTSVAGHYVYCPLLLFRIQESILRLLPVRLSKAIARISLPWCVRMVGIKKA